MLFLLLVSLFVHILYRKYFYPICCSSALLIKLHRAHYTHINSLPLFLISTTKESQTASATQLLSTPDTHEAVYSIPIFENEFSNRGHNLDKSFELISGIPPLESFQLRELRSQVCDEGGRQSHLLNGSERPGRRHRLRRCTAHHGSDSGTKPFLLCDCWEGGTCCWQ